MAFLVIQFFFPSLSFFLSSLSLSNSQSGLGLTWIKTGMGWGSRGLIGVGEKKQGSPFSFFLLFFSFHDLILSWRRRFVIPYVSSCSLGYHNATSHSLYRSDELGLVGLCQGGRSKKGPFSSKKKYIGYRFFPSTFLSHSLSQSHFLHAIFICLFIYQAFPFFFHISFS